MDLIEHILTVARLGVLALLPLSAIMLAAVLRSAQHGLVQVITIKE